MVDASALSAFLPREERWKDPAGYLAYAVAARTGALTGQEAGKALSLLL